MVEEGSAELFIRFHLSLNRDNQLCCLFPYQMLGGPELCHIPNPDHLSGNLSGIENVLKTLLRKELPGESRRALLDFHKQMALLLLPRWPIIPVTTPHTLHVMPFDRGEAEPTKCSSTPPFSSLSSQLESWGRGDGTRGQL